MWYWLERFLSNPVAFAFTLVVGGGVLYALYKREKARRAEAAAEPKSGPFGRSGDVELDFTSPGTPSRRSSSANQRPPADVGEETASRRRAATPSGSRPAPVPSSGVGRPTGSSGGFRDMRWGTAPSLEMVSYHEEADTHLYVRKGEPLKLGDAPVTSILYSYWKERLDAVMIEMPDSSADRVISDLTREWGQPKRAPGSASKFFWTDVGSGEQATQAVMEKTPLARKASLLVSSKALKAEKARSGGK